MGRTSPEEYTETNAEPAEAPRHFRERAARLEQLCQALLDRHYEEIGLLDLGAGRVQALPELEAARIGPLLAACAEDYGAGVRGWIADRAFGDEDRQALSALLPEALTERLRQAGRVSAGSRGFRRGGRSETCRRRIAPRRTF